MSPRCCWNVRKGNEKAKAPLCRSSDDARPRLQPLSYAFCHRDGTQLDGKGCELLGRERAKKGFQYYFGFAKTGVEVIVQKVEALPAIGWLDRKAPTEVFGCLVELANDMLNGIGKDAQLLEEARAVGKQDVVKKFVPVSGVLSSFSAEEFSLEGLDQRKISQVATAGGKCVASGNKCVSNAHEQISRHENLLARTDKFAACAQR
jgi:hypothetical protein